MNFEGVQKPCLTTPSWEMKHVDECQLQRMEGEIQIDIGLKSHQKTWA
jgi:hypothetical protein